MKRDMDLVRHILLRTEAAESEYDIDRLVTDKWSHAMVGYHVDLLAAHDLIDCRLSRDINGDITSGTVIALTWDGCDYLDAIRNDMVWARTKKAVSESVGATTLDIVRQAACMVALQAVKAKLGMP